MNKNDITKDIMNFHKEETITNLLDNIKEELKSGIPAKLQNELSTLLSTVNQADNIVDFKKKRSNKNLLMTNLGSIELLAAAGQSLGDWFSQPLNFGGAGFILDVRKVIGTDNEVDLYLSPNQEETGNMQKSLKAYKGHTIHIIISNNGEHLLDANIYIDETGSAAEGSGFLIKPQEEKKIKGKLSIDIIVKE